MTGRLIYVMGPSGAGKDTILQALVGLMGDAVYLAPRIVTRRDDASGPDVASALMATPGLDGASLSNAASVSKKDSTSSSASVSDDVFKKLELSGVFAMSWRANGLAYGIDRIDIDPKLSQGLDVLINGSRQYFEEACQRYPALVPVLLDVPAAILEARLQARGRESAAQIQQRLDRNARFASLSDAHTHRAIIRVDNTGTVERAVAQLHAGLIADADVNATANSLGDRSCA